MNAPTNPDETGGDHLDKPWIVLSKRQTGTFAGFVSVFCFGALFGSFVLAPQPVDEACPEYHAETDASSDDSKPVESASAVWVIDGKPDSDAPATKERDRHESEIQGVKVQHRI